MSKDQQFKELVFKEYMKSGYIARECAKCRAWTVVGMGNIAVCASCLHEMPRL